MNRSIPRRRFLQFATAAAAGLPFVRALESRAGGMTAPKRLVVWFTPNGIIEDQWLPTGSERDFVLSEILEPLAPLQSKLNVINGLSIKSGENDQEGDGHKRPMCNLLTGTESVAVDGASFGGGVSVDQEIAATVGRETFFSSLELGVRIGGDGTNGGNRMCYAGAGQPLPPREDPVAAFDAIFGGIDPDDPEAAAEAEARRARRQSVLDTVKLDFVAMRDELGAGHKRRVEEHFDALRDIEEQLVGLADLGECQVPTEPGAVPDNAWNEFTNMPQIGSAHMDTLAMSLACGLTNVGSLQWNRAAANTTFPWLDINEWHHELSHLADDASLDKLVEINRWYNEQLAHFAGLLDSMTDVDGNTVLDNTLIVCVNELGEGIYHTHEPMHFLTLGGCGGAVPTGRFLNYENVPHNEFLLSICNAFGLGLDTFGDPNYCASELPGFLA